MQYDRRTTSPSGAALETGTASWAAGGGDAGGMSLPNSRSTLVCRCRCRASRCWLGMASPSHLLAASDRLDPVPPGGLFPQRRRLVEPPPPLPPRLAPRLLLGVALPLAGLPHLGRRAGLL